jgi:hypothetical protein
MMYVALTETFLKAAYSSVSVQLLFEDGTTQNVNDPPDVITSPRQSFFDRQGGVGITSSQILERNQRELHREISELRSALESQGKLVRRLVRALEAKTEI